MKKTKICALLIASLSLFANAAQAPKAQNSNIFCDLFGIGCPVVVISDTQGNGSEPPQAED